MFYFLFTILQSPVMKGVELVNGGYGIKNPLLTQSQTENRQGALGKCKTLCLYIQLSAAPVGMD